MYIFWKLHISHSELFSVYLGVYILRLCWKWRVLGWTKKTRTEPSQTDPTGSKPNQNICLNHLVHDFINPSGSVWFDFKLNQTKDL